jgi:hypothetical protein
MGTATLLPVPSDALDGLTFPAGLGVTSTLPLPKSMASAARPPQVHRKVDFLFLSGSRRPLRPEE